MLWLAIGPCPPVGGPPPPISSSCCCANDSAVQGGPRTVLLESSLPLPCYLQLHAAEFISRGIAHARFVIVVDFAGDRRLWPVHFRVWAGMGRAPASDEQHVGLKRKCITACTRLAQAWLVPGSSIRLAKAAQPLAHMARQKRLQRAQIYSSEWCSTNEYRNRGELGQQSQHAAGGSGAATAAAQARAWDQRRQRCSRRSDLRESSGGFRNSGTNGRQT